MPDRALAGAAPPGSAEARMHAWVRQQDRYQLRLAAAIGAGPGTVVGEWGRVPGAEGHRVAGASTGG